MKNKYPREIKEKVLQDQIELIHITNHLPQMTSQGTIAEVLTLITNLSI